ncbi:Acyl-coenzyme A thioesterase 11 [Choanephora cucurbitarum]|uniref:Acyl-coenzyme A thioesterase 11 n=1 Tax=Choanephora cucurbitarum TaxID=101091 RepID=A0A1C7N695_9FUNG|nr:Acyl-coenzyme A thioesterase 11 [Choanephora cucurbitarum]
MLPDPYTTAGHVRVSSKPAHESRVTMTEFIHASHCNLKGFAYAGTILSWIDVAAGIAAKRHAVSPSVTRSVDDVAFLHPVKLGDIVYIQASVNKSWKTSMEVGVKVEAESPLVPGRFFVAHAYLTFVALSPRPSARTHVGRILSDLQTISVPALIPQSSMEQKRYEMAETRRQARLRRVQPDHHLIRDRMREWSQGLRQRTDPDAPVRVHPGYDEKPDRVLQRRFSQDPRMVEQQEGAKPIRSTFAEVVELVMPQHANTLQITFGGQIMAWMEQCALASANQLVKAYLLTANSGVGDVVTIRSIVSRAFNSSMEVYVTVEAENLLTGETKFTNDGFFTITASDHEHVPVMIPKVIPQTECGIEIFEGGQERRQLRLDRRKELIALITASQRKG